MNHRKAILILNSYQTGIEEKSQIIDLDPRSLLITTLIYIICILSLPIEIPEKLIWFAAYPIIMAPISGINYISIFLKSLYVLPFIVLIGLANPIYDKRAAFEIGGVVISYGWLSFLTIILRGLLSMQALIILIRNSGFIGICNALNRMRVPKILTTQLLLLYRYMGLLIEEAFSMHRAISSRGYGKKSFPIKMWVTVVGSLLIRTYERSKRIYDAMLSRGFNGQIPLGENHKLHSADFIFCAMWTLLFLFLTFFNVGQFLFPSNSIL